ncbi:hypothetical protein JST97_04050 [bacterium]|nr:hypothetical protein [bacterium]
MAFPSLDPLSQLGGVSPLGAGSLTPAFQGGDLASMRCAGLPGMQSMDPTSSLLASSQQLMGQMLQLMTVMLMGLMLNGSAGASGSPSDPLGAVNGGGGVNAAGSSSGGGDVAQQPAPGGGSVKSGSKVLVIGDSHTAGAFGDELDRLLRAKGAQVHTVGSSGATADNYISGKGTTVGYADHKANGQTEKTSSHATPKLEDLINEDKPDTIIVNLGANFRGAGPSGIKKQVDEIGEIAKRHNIKITWVGPPTTRQDEGNPGSLDKFDQDMKAAVAPYGNYVSSRPFTPHYNGPDGIHYSGAEAKKWAAGVAGAI